MKKLLLVLILFFVCTINCFAANYDDSFYSGEWIPNIYINKVKSGVIHYRQARYIRRSSDKGIAYCIEPFEEMKYNLKYNSYSDNYAKRLGISDSTWKKISLIAYYGYGYAGHKEDKWYAITQVMIWREIDKKAQFYFTSTLNGSKTNKFDDEIEEINSLITNHSKLPSFANETYEFSIDSENILTDTNKVLNNFSISTSNDKLIINKEGNKLDIKTSEEVSTSILFERKFSNYNRKPIIFVDSDYQNLMTPGNIDNVTFKIGVNVNGGIVKIKKIDFDSEKEEPQGDGILIGSTYTIYDEDNNIIDSLVIGEDYQATSKLLPYGSYILKETKSMNGYYLDEEEYKFIIDSNNLSYEMTLKNKAIKSTIEIYKYYDDKLESGVSFEVYNSKGELIDTMTTDENGKIVKDFYYGTYLIHQVNSIKNYKCVDDFTIKIDNETPAIYRIELNDEKFSVKLKIIKYDGKTQEIIKDEAIFKILDVEKDNYLEVDGIQEFKTQEGILIIDKIYAGKYELEEVSAPAGYKKLNESISFIIDDENNFSHDENNQLVYELRVKNELEEIEIEVPDTSQSYNDPFYFILVVDEKKKLMNRLSH